MCWYIVRIIDSDIPKHVLMIYSLIHIVISMQKCFEMKFFQMNTMYINIATHIETQCYVWCSSVSLARNRSSLHNLGATHRPMPLATELAPFQSSKVISLQHNDGRRLLRFSRRKESQLPSPVFSTHQSPNFFINHCWFWLASCFL